MHKIALTTCTLGALLCACPALADVLVKQSDNRSMNRVAMEVRYADLNLDSQEGIERLNQRLVSAVKTVCGDADIRALRAMGQMRECREVSLARAYADRDALFEARLAARENPAQLASLDRAGLRIER